MQTQPYELCVPLRQKSFCVFSSPHSGTAYSETFKNDFQLDFLKLRSSEDAFVNELFSEVTTYGSPLISANAPRSFVDLNRDESELDPELIFGLRGKVNYKPIPSGLGVIPRVVANGRVIKSGKISFQEAKERLNNYYYPYHKELAKTLRTTRSVWGKVVLFDCHSMPQQAVKSLTNLGKKVPDIILGDCFGKSCDRHILEKTEDAFIKQGFNVVRNRPFSGGFITQNYGDPKLKQHAIQIEINRSLYMNELEIEKIANFNDFKRRISAVLYELVQLGVEQKSIAAE